MGSATVQKFSKEKYGKLSDEKRNNPHKFFSYNNMATLSLFW